MFKKVFLLLGPLLLVLVVAGCNTPGRSAPRRVGEARLSVMIEGFRSDRGLAIVSLFDRPEGFPDSVAASRQTLSVSITNASARAVFENLSRGEYAVSVLHDEDGDGRMSTSLFGLPREGFGFSGKPGYWFGQPTFNEASFLLLDEAHELSVSMRYETGRRDHQQQRQQQRRQGEPDKP